MRCKKFKKRKREREKSVYLIISFERTRLFLFLPDCLRCQALEVGPAQVMVDRSAFVKMLVKPRANSTAKRYLVAIRRFLGWCKQNSVADNYPSSSTVLTVYLFQLFTDQHKSYSVLLMVHAALKWFHSFVPINRPNPLDDAYAMNAIKSAKRARGNPILKKEPISTDLIEKIID